LLSLQLEERINNNNSSNKERTVMADVNEELPEEVMEMLNEVVVKQCLQLAFVAKIMSTEERAKNVAAFMQRTMADFCTLNLVERTLVVRFITQTHVAIEKAMRAAGQYKNSDKEVHDQLEKLIEQTKGMADLSYVDYKADQDKKKKGGDDANTIPRRG
jgi:hypothetical protein